MEIGYESLQRAICGSSPSRGEWLVCSVPFVALVQAVGSGSWDFMEFLYAPSPRKGSGSTKQPTSSISIICQLAIGTCYSEDRFNIHKLAKS